MLRRLQLIWVLVCLALSSDVLLACDDLPLNVLLVRDKPQPDHGFAGSEVLISHINCGATFLRNIGLHKTLKWMLWRFLWFYCRDLLLTYLNRSHIFSRPAAFSFALITQGKELWYVYMYEMCNNSIPVDIHCLPRQNSETDKRSIRDIRFNLLLFIAGRLSRAYSEDEPTETKHYLCGNSVAVDSTSDLSVTCHRGE